jgi:hypothetical protein
VTGSDVTPEPVEPFEGPPNLHGGRRHEYNQQDLDDADHSPVGPTARFYPKSRNLADRDPKLPISYRIARWSATALIATATILTAWWLAQASIFNWCIGLLWHYLSWLPFVG